MMGVIKRCKVLSSRIFEEGSEIGRLFDMGPRLKYGQLAPEGLAKMSELEHYLNTGSGLEATLLDLVQAEGFVDEWL